MEVLYIKRFVRFTIILFKLLSNQHFSARKMLFISNQTSVYSVPLGIGHAAVELEVWYPSNKCEMIKVILKYEILNLIF